MTITVALVTLVLQTPADPPIPVLRPGDEIESEIVETDSIVHTPTLDEHFAKAPVRAKTFRVEHYGGGPFHIDAHSHFFDTYLVVRGSDGEVLVENNDGSFNTHSHVGLDAGAPTELSVQVGALLDGLGPFRLVVLPGRVEELDPRDGAARDLADARAAVEARESTLGPVHPNTATSLYNLALVLKFQGALDEARPLFERALRIDEATMGPNHPSTASSLNSLAKLLYEKGAYDEARPLFERALRIRETALGPDHQETANSLYNLAVLLISQGAYGEARRLYERVLRIDESTLGPNHPGTASSLSSLAALLHEKGAYDEARPLFERALRIRETALGPDHPETANSVNNLAVLLKSQGAYDEALPLRERALRISEDVFGPDHPETANSLNNLAVLLSTLGEYDEARPLYERALRIRETALGPDHPETSTSLSNLALLLETQGAYDEARPLFERALRINETAFGPTHLDTAVGLSTLAGLLESQGAYNEARPLLERSLRIRETVFGPDHPRTATGLHNLAVLLSLQGAYDEARPLYERALRIDESTLGPDHPDTATSLSALARLLSLQGAFDEALPLHERALRIHESTLGPGHPETAHSLSNLALLLRSQGALDEAQPLFERALRIRETAFGLVHPKTARSLNDLALLEADLGELSAGFLRSRASFAASAGQYSRVAWSMSESERLAFLRTLRSADELVISLARALGSEDARESAYAAVLEGKGRVGRGLLRDGLRALGRLPEEQRALIRKLRVVQQQLSDAIYAASVADPGARAEKLDELRGERNVLEVDLARLRGKGEGKEESGKGRGKGARLAVLREALPADAVAIDFLVQRWYEPAEWKGEGLVRMGRWTEAHLSAWVTRQSGSVAQVDLGEASVLKEAVRVFLARTVGRRGVPAAVAETDEMRDPLRELLWDPLRQAVGDARVVFLSGDGFLGGLPFEILQDEDGSYLIERHAFAYEGDLTGLTDVMRSNEAESPCLFAAGGIDYWTHGDAEQPDDPLAFGDLRAPVSRVFSDLRWTDREVSAVAGLHRSVAGRDAQQVVLRGVDATEERIKAGLSGFTHVHLATHGFFHPEGVPNAWKNLREQDDVGLSLMRESEQRVVGYLPGLLSGLVFAGANAEPEPGRDNGLLTAEEITYLDLTSCDLVVLSACETGLGRPEAGEGMIGLRRAFRMAGARTVISSLWEVDDQATRDLMTLFYENLWRRGMPKLEALRQAQLSILEENRRRTGHGVPSTWGAFVLDGAPE